MTQDVLFGVCYVPPEGTKYASNDCFLEIEQELIHLAHEQIKPVCSMGDFNARTGTLPDFFTPGPGFSKDG